MAVIARWLGRTRRELPRLNASELAADGRSSFQSGAHLEVATACEEQPLLYALRYVHQDSDVPGRVWFTDIGVASAPADRVLELTIQVRTDEISSRVVSKIEASRPGFVVELANEDLLDGLTPGLDVKTLGDEYAAHALRQSLDDPNRREAYVIVSPSAEGEYCVTPEIIRTTVIGLAEVVQIPPGADTLAISNALGREFSAWRGSISVVLPPRGAVGSRTVKFLPNMLSELADQGLRIDSAILEAVAHRSNVIHSARLVSIGNVRDVRQHRELARRKVEASLNGDVSEFATLLENENASLERRVRELEDRLLSEQIGHEDDVAKLRYENDALKLQLAYQPPERGAGEDSSDTLRRLVSSLIDGCLTLEDALELIKRLFPERVVVLPSATRSAKRSHGFRKPEDALLLLKRLATDYFFAMADGDGGDAKARQLFGNQYSARESESVETNRRARELRTFEYLGQPVEMMRHLKIGVKDSASETLRIHFTWDPRGEKIVIGHCGPHLDFG